MSYNIPFKIIWPFTDTKPFVRTTVGEFLWGYPSVLLSMKRQQEANCQVRFNSFNTGILALMKRVISVSTYYNHIFFLGRSRGRPIFWGWRRLFCIWRCCRWRNCRISGRGTENQLWYCARKLSSIRIIPGQKQLNSWSQDYKNR